MAQTSKTALKVVFGAMTIGEADAESTRVHTLEEASGILDVFQKHGHDEVDTALVYGGGSSEKYLGQLHWADRGIVMATKFSPRVDLGQGPGKPTTHTPENLREALKRSLNSLQTDKIDLWYLHAPDHSTPYDVTMREVNNLCNQGYFRRFGLSNYAAWEVAQICEVCDKMRWVKPTVYQGVYNAFHRAVEPELLPCLKHYGIAFYAYNPLAGGYLTDRYDRSMLTESKDIEEGSRFDPSKRQGKNYRKRYFSEEYFDALDILRGAIKTHGLTEAEAALRWEVHHSDLENAKGDAIIIGASSANQLEQNLSNLEKGPLPDEIVEAFDEGWRKVKGVCLPYYR